jgi:formylmethanofuran dehydrogenase subunit E
MKTELPRKKICGRSLQDVLNTIESFHGWTAPGIVLGGFMVDWAQELIGPGIESDAIVETSYCLPDAVQLFTPCTVGNGWLKILDWDKFALSLYDRKKLAGYRIWLDLDRTRQFPDLYNWYMRLVAKKDLPLEILIETIFNAGRSVLSSRAIHMTHFYQRKKKGQIEVCSGCGEAYPAAQGPQCTACLGNGYYE